MPMTQDDIRVHYEKEWRAQSDRATDVSHLSYSNPVEDAVLYPIYERLIRDLNIRVAGGRVLDVGCGSGRWVRFFLDRFSPALLVGIDYTQASIDLLHKWSRDNPRTRFECCDITSPGAVATINEKFDLINIANVLFHIPETEKFAVALANLAQMIEPGVGRIVTTEYMPRSTMRTNWMMVRSRYEFETACSAAGLRIVDVRPTTFFANDPMGLDGPDQATRGHFHKVRAGVQTMLSANVNAETRTFFQNFLADVERCLLAYCAERLAAIDLPSQKLVVLARVD